MADEVIRVVIVEDEALTRHLLVHVLSELDGITVAASAGDGRTASEVIDEQDPDVILLDLDLGSGDDGFAVGRAARRNHPDLGIVVLTGRPDFNEVRNVILGEGSGWSFLLKQSVPDTATVARAIHGAATGMIVIDPLVVAHLRPRDDSLLARLSPKQLEILQLVAQGFTSEAIADRLGISRRTVVHHLNEVYERLGVRENPDMNPRLSAAMLYVRDSQESLR